VSPCPHTTQTLFAQADLFLLLSYLLRDPRVNDAPSPSDGRMVATLALPHDGETATLIEQLLTCAAATPREERSAEHQRLFEGSMACPSNEAAYIRRDKGALLGDISGFYQAFGLATSPATGERPDHMRCELEYMAMLLFMLARAREQGAQEEGEITLGALRDFYRDHLADWFGSFCATLRATATLEVYTRLADALERTIPAVAVDLGLPASSAEMRQPTLDGLDELACGTMPSPLPSSVTIDGRAIPQ